MDIYKKTDGVWSVVSSLPSVPGPNGSTGPTGPTGSTGAMGFAQPFGANLPNLKFVSLYKTSTSTGNVDIYTVPAGRRALFLGGNMMNNAVGSNSYFFQVKVGSTYYPLTAVASAGAGATTTNVALSAYVAEVGEKLSINVSAQPFNVWGIVYEFDDTAALKTSKITTVIAGDNPIYTVPVGKSAILVPPNMLATAAQNAVAYGNLSGGAITVGAMYFVPSGGSSGSTTMVRPSWGSVANGTGISFASPATLNTGDIVMLNLSANTAGQMCWVTVIEV